MSDNPQQRIESEVRQALKARQKEKLSTLRMLLNAINNERIRSGREVDDVAFAGLVRQAIKQRREASEQFRQGGRDELAEREEREAEILADYLPPAVSDRELRSAIEEIVAAQELSGPQAIGPVMQQMMARFGHRADGGTINRLAREILSD